jgi:hypothetical protein
MSHEEIVAAHAAEKAHERGSAVRVFGEEGAKRYEKLDRARNSQDHVKADAAQAEIEKMEAGLTEAQKKDLFGIGETGLNEEQLRNAVRASEIHQGIESVPDAEFAGNLERSFLSRHALGDLPDRIRMARVMKEAVRRGWSGERVEAIIKAGAQSRGIEPDDAMILVRGAMERGKREPKAGTAAPAERGKPAERRSKVPAPVVGAKAEVVRRGAAPLAPAVEAPTKKAAAPTRAARGGVTKPAAEPQKPAAESRGIAAFHERETSMGTKLREEWRVRQRKTPADDDAARALVGPYGTIDGPFNQERRYIRDGVEGPWETIGFYMSKTKALEDLYLHKNGVALDPQLVKIQEARAAKAEADAKALEEARARDEERDRVHLSKQASEQAFVRMKQSPKTAKMAEEWNAAMVRLKPRSGEFAKDPEFMRLYNAAIGATTVPSKAKAMRLLLEYARTKEPKAPAATALDKVWDGVAKGEEGKVPIGDAFDALIDAALKHDLKQQIKRGDKGADVRPPEAPREVVEKYAKAAEHVTRAEQDIWDRLHLGVEADNMAGLWKSAGEAWQHFVTGGGEGLRRSGWAGRALNKGMQGWAKASDRRGATLAVDLGQRVKGMTEQQLEAIGHRMNGDADATRGVGEATAALRKVQEDLFTEAEEQGVREVLASGKVVPIRQMENHFPQQIKRKFRRSVLRKGTPSHAKQIAYMLEKNPGMGRSAALRELQAWLKRPSEFTGGGLQHERRMNLHPDLREWNVLRVLPQYYMRTTRRIEQARFFGPENENGWKLVDAIGKSGHDWRTAGDLFGYAIDPTTRRFAEGLRAVTDIAVVSFLSTAGLVQPTQLGNTVSVVGYTKTIRGIIEVIRDPEARRWAERSGATARNIAHEFGHETARGGLAELHTKLIGLTPGDRWNRLVSAAAARMFAPEIAMKFYKNPKNRALRRRIQRMGLDRHAIMAQKGKLTPEQLFEAAQTVSNRGQFASSPLDLPPATNEWYGRGFMLFRKFAYQEGTFFKSLVKDAVEVGDVAPLLRKLTAMATINVVFGELARKARELLSGQKRKRSDNLAWRLIEDQFFVQQFGLWGDLVMATARGSSSLAGWASGLALSELYRFAPEAFDAVVPQTDSKHTSGRRLHPRKLVRHVLSRLTKLGPRVADWLAPAEGQPSRNPLSAPREANER